MGDRKLTETIELLHAWAKGDQAALENLTPRVYKELQRLAACRMRNFWRWKTM